ncbi:regulator of transcription factor TFIID [Klebsiella oxytoca]|nr:regulator of transcription factor TFIID [Klebsiella oxytoca]
MTFTADINNAQMIAQFPLIISQPMRPPDISDGLTGETGRDIRQRLKSGYGNSRTAVVTKSVILRQLFNPV